MPDPFPVPPFTPDGLIGVPLRAGDEPGRIVVIRLHAFGDTAITFPVLAALRRRLPGVRLDVVTDVRSAGLFAAHRDVDGVHSFDTRRSKVWKGVALLGVALALREALGERLFDFAGRTSPGMALALVSLASLVVSDDSGLMHLAWVQGVPTVALFGSSRSSWSRPEGPRSDGVYSEDLACGACMQPVCGRGDLLCLTRVRVEDVLEKCLPVVHGGTKPRPA